MGAILSVPAGRASATILRPDAGCEVVLRGSSGFVGAADLVVVTGPVSVEAIVVVVAGGTLIVDVPAGVVLVTVVCGTGAVAAVGVVARVLAGFVALVAAVVGVAVAALVTVVLGARGAAVGVVARVLVGVVAAMFGPAVTAGALLVTAVCVVPAVPVAGFTGVAAVGDVAAPVEPAAVEAGELVAVVCGSDVPTGPIEEYGRRWPEMVAAVPDEAPVATALGGTRRAGQAITLIDTVVATNARHALGFACLNASYTSSSTPTGRSELRKSNETAHRLLAMPAEAVLHFRAICVDSTSIGLRTTVQSATRPGRDKVVSSSCRGDDRTPGGRAPVGAALRKQLLEQAAGGGGWLRSDRWPRILDRFDLSALHLSLLSFPRSRERIDQRSHTAPAGAAGGVAAASM